MPAPALPRRHALIAGLGVGLPAVARSLPRRFPDHAAVGDARYTHADEVFAELDSPRLATGLTLVPDRGCTTRWTTTSSWHRSAPNWAAAACSRCRATSRWPKHRRRCTTC